MRTILLVLCLAGCMANNGLGSLSMATDNISNLSRISVGMSQSQVLHIMRHPYSQETYAVQGDTYDVWFYVTKPTVLGQSRMVHQNLTPLTFKNGSLLGWGYDHYHHIFKEPEKKPAPPPQKEEIKKIEDIKLEKALEGKGTGEGDISMAKPPKPAPEEDDEEKERCPGEKDDRMIEEADEQNFDFW